MKTAAQLLELAHSIGEVPLLTTATTIPAGATYNAPTTVDLRGQRLAYGVAIVGPSDSCQVFGKNEINNGGASLYPFAGSATGSNTLLTGVAGPQTGNTNGFTGTETLGVVNKSTTAAATLSYLGFIAN